VPGIVPTLDCISRHSRFRGHLAEALDLCARLPITGRGLAAVVHHCRSEAANVSSMTMSLTNPLVGCDGEREADVMVGVRVRDGAATVTVSPAVVAHGRASDSAVASTVGPIRLLVLSSMAVLFMQGS
jgi:hypothetical protein